MIKSIFRIINIKIFLLSFFFGLLFTYFNDDKKKIYVYPNPSNIEIFEYKDKADNCFEYMMEEIKCPLDKSKINNIPIQ